MEQERKWSRDWEHFDWKPILQNLSEGEKCKAQGIEIDIGISKDEVINFFEWMKKTESSEYYGFMIFMMLREKGII